MAYSQEDARRLILEAGIQLLQEGLIARTWGNISARVSEDAFVITPSGIAYEHLTADDLVTVRIADNGYESAVTPSSERKIHSALYGLRKDVNFIVHTHQPLASALSLSPQTAILTSDAPVAQREILGDQIPVARHALSGTERLRDNLLWAASHHPACNAMLMQHHGAICLGKDHDHAFAIAHALEAVCRNQFEAICGPYQPPLPRQVRLSNRQFTIQYPNQEVGTVLHVTTPYVMHMSKRGRSLPPYLDDQAMIGGFVTRVASSRPSEKALNRALRFQGAVFLQGQGALCVGPTPEDAQAMASVLEKNCLAAYYGLATGASPVPRPYAYLERGIYVFSYAKRNR